MHKIFCPNRRNLSRLTAVNPREAKTARALKPELQADSERRLIEAAQRDPGRFADLYERNFDRVYAYVARRVHDRAAAEDVVSEVFHHALAHLGSFEWRGKPFCAWLYRIAANALADRYKKADRESGTAKKKESETAVLDDVERRALLAELVNTLPPEQRRVVVQRFVEQRSIKEIARAMQRSEGAVKQLQFRALQSLRAHLEDAHD
jgi:RNA polymerase sigma-70 factor, ECF subfamily